jgi:hypothetical protein
MRPDAVSLCCPVLHGAEPRPIPWPVGARPVEPLVTRTGNRGPTTPGLPTACHRRRPPLGPDGLLDVAASGSARPVMAVPGPPRSGQSADDADGA